MPPRRLNHAQIAEDLQARIESGDYKAGEKLPSYRELMEIYSVSHATIQRALGILRYTGAVEGVPGVGVFVAAGPRH